MRIVSFISYRPSCYGGVCGGPSTGPSYIVRGLKGLVPGRSAAGRRLACCCPQGLKTQQEAIDWFGCLGALVLESRRLERPLQLVPVPNSTCTVAQQQPPSTLLLAEAIASATTAGAEVSDCLRWARPQAPSHLGGTRDRTRLFRDLVLVSNPRRGKVVLIDDVVTTGAHLETAAARLQREGFECHDAICVARTERVLGPSIVAKVGWTNVGLVGR